MNARNATTSPAPTSGRRRIVATGALVAVTTGLLGVGTVLGPALSQEPSDEAPATETPAVQTETIERSSLVETKEAVGSVGNGDAWTLPIQGQGVVTARHDKGTIVGHGEPLIWRDTLPTYLVKGDVPMYRTLELTGTTVKKHQQGEDVRQLQEYLIEVGFDDAGRLEADGIFGAGTKRAVKAWQKANGFEQTGAIDRTQIIFSPAAVRIDSTPRVGSDFIELTVTAAAQEIRADFETKSAPFLNVGDEVALDYGSGEPATGTITEVTPSVGDDGTRTLTAVIEPSQLVPTGTERVTVTASRTTASDALVVPVRAVLALAGGGYGIEVDTGSGTELRRIEVGAVVDARAEITGDIEAGDEVIVPVDPIGGAS